jgi:hypothetical protein
MHDVSHFIITALTVDLRRRHERELLAFYRDRLGSYGVTDLPHLDTLWPEYRRGVSWSFCRAWFCTPPVNYGRDIMPTGLIRTGTAYEDLKTKEAVANLL